MANPEHERLLREAIKSKAASVDMSGFDLSGVLLASVSLEGVNLANANLQQADLSGAMLRGGNFRGAKLSKARLVFADMRSVDLEDCDLRASDMSSAVLSNCTLGRADLRKAKLVRTRLDGANLTGANLLYTDLRGVVGLTKQMLHSARNSAKAILDEKMLADFGMTGDATIARHGKALRQHKVPKHVDLMFVLPKPSFEDLYRICGEPDTRLTPTKSYGFELLADLGIEQVDDYFAICVDGDPAVWIYPLVRGQVVDHHPGPFDGIRIDCVAHTHQKIWAQFVKRFRTVLTEHGVLSSAESTWGQ